MQTLLQNNFPGSNLSHFKHQDLPHATQTKKQSKELSMISTRKSSNDSIDTKPKFKTEICKYWLMKITCPFEGFCCFAHGQQQMRRKESLPSKYKTRVCSRFEQEGYCSYGSRCQFIHHQSKQICKYQNLIEKIGNGYFQFLEEIESVFIKKSRRLSFFQNLVEKLEDNDPERLISAQIQQYEGIFVANNNYRMRYNSI